MSKVTLTTEEITGKMESFIVTQEELDQALIDGRKTVGFLPSYGNIMKLIVENRLEQTAFDHRLQVINYRLGQMIDPDYELYVKLCEKFKYEIKSDDVIRKELIENWERAI